MMHPLRKQRLSMIISLLCVLCIVIGLILYAVRQNISLFYTPTQIHQAQAPLHQRIRVGGMVVKGSLVKQQGQRITFKITDFTNELNINYQGILPDLFREGQGVVINGELTDSSTLKAYEVLAKHDEKYMPPELKSLNQHKKNR